MSIDLGPSQHQDEVLSQINTTPLVDVMLVLLIIFLITIPVVTSSVPVALPQERVEPRQVRPDNVVISVDRSGAIYWHETRVADIGELTRRLAQVAHQTPPPEVQIRGDLAGTYEGVGLVLLACQRAGIVKVAFITEPPAAAAGG